MQNERYINNYCCDNNAYKYNGVIYIGRVGGLSKQPAFVRQEVEKFSNDIFETPVGHECLW